MKLLKICTISILIVLLSPVFSGTVIYNPNPVDLIDYQVRIDLSDVILGTPVYLAVTDKDGNKLPFCYEQPNGECNTTPSNIIWVKVPFIPANGVTYLVITKSDTNQATDASNVFIRVIDGLVAAYHFDEGEGNIAHDSSGNENHGKIYGARWVDGKFGKALYFGEGDYVLLEGEDFDFSKYNEFTILAWVKKTSTGAGAILGYCPGDISKRSPSMWFYPKEDDFHFGFGDSSEWLATIIYDVVGTHNWYFVGIRWSYNSGKLEGILNGNIVGYVDTGSSKPYPNTVYYIGKADYSFRGIVDEVLIFNKALTEDEIKDLYENYPHTTQTGKVYVRKYADQEPKILHKIINPHVSVSYKKPSSNSYSYHFSYLFTLPIRIVSNTPIAMTSVTIPITLNTERLIAEGILKSDCSDIAISVYDPITDREVPVPFYLDPITCNDDNTIIYVKIPDYMIDKDTLLFIYLGSPDAISMSSPDAFLYFVDFSRPSDYSKIQIFATGDASYDITSEGLSVNIATGKLVIYNK